MVKQSPRKLRLGFLLSLRASQPLRAQEYVSYICTIHTTQEPGSRWLAILFFLNLYLKYAEYNTCKPTREHHSTYLHLHSQVLYSTDRLQSHDSFRSLLLCGFLAFWQHLIFYFLPANHDTRNTPPKVAAIIQITLHPMSTLLLVKIGKWIWVSQLSGCVFKTLSVLEINIVL